MFLCVLCSSGCSHVPMDTQPQVKGDWIKPGAIVIDVGINSVDDPTSKKG
jgi:5,10-methylene-tetrahydrofolate dehydrogenase/methenyl tetrahydrofolate cyclohydrolase